MNKYHFKYIFLYLYLLVIYIFIYHSKTFHPKAMKNNDRCYFYQLLLVIFIVTVIIIVIFDVIINKLGSGWMDGNSWNRPTN